MHLTNYSINKKNENFIPPGVARPATPPRTTAPTTPFAEHAPTGHHTMDERGMSNATDGTTGKEGGQNVRFVRGKPSELT